MDSSDTRRTRPRRTVLMTAGLTASASVLAANLILLAPPAQADPGGPAYGDSQILDPDNGADPGAEPAD